MNHHLEMKHFIVEMKYTICQKFVYSYLSILLFEKILLIELKKITYRNNIRYLHSENICTTKCFSISPKNFQLEYSTKKNIFL